MIRNNCTIPWWAWGIMSIIFASTLTRIGSIAAIITAIIMVAVLVGRQWIKAHPFTMMVSLDPYDFKHIGKNRRQRRLVKRMDLELDDNKILIYVSPKKGTLWDRVNIRFVNRKFSPRLTRIWRYENSDPDIIQVTDFRDVIYKTKGEIWGRYFECDPDGVGGYNGIYDPPLTVKAGELVWFEIYVRANDTWSGLASFEGALENRRAWTRIKARVLMPKVIKENGKSKRLTKKQFNEVLD